MNINIRKKLIYDSTVLLLNRLGFPRWHIYNHRLDCIFFYMYMNYVMVKLQLFQLNSWILLLITVHLINYWKKRQSISCIHLHVEGIKIIPKQYRCFKFFSMILIIRTLIKCLIIIKPNNLRFTLFLIYTVDLDQSDPDRPIRYSLGILLMFLFS